MSWHDFGLLDRSFRWSGVGIQYCSYMYVREDGLVLIGRQCKLRCSLRQSSVESLDRFAICSKLRPEIDES